MYANFTLCKIIEKLAKNLTFQKQNMLPNFTNKQDSTQQKYSNDHLGTPILQTDFPSTIVRVWRTANSKE